jgi:hypothetical protein
MFRKCKRIADNQLQRFNISKHLNNVVIFTYGESDIINDSNIKDLINVESFSLIYCNKNYLTSYESFLPHILNNQITVDGLKKISKLRELYLYELDELDCSSGFDIRRVCELENLRTLYFNKPREPCVFKHFTYLYKIACPIHHGYTTEHYENVLNNNSCGNKFIAVPTMDENIVEFWRVGKFDSVKTFEKDNYSYSHYEWL